VLCRWWLGWLVGYVSCPSTKVRVCIPGAVLGGDWTQHMQVICQASTANRLMERREVHSLSVGQRWPRHELCLQTFR
jgi:hypothetical protein